MKLCGLVIISLELLLVYDLGIIGQGNCVILAKGIHQQVGTTIVQLSERLPRNRRSGDQNTSSAELPVEFDLHLRVAGSNVSLRLHRNDNIPPAVPIFVKKNGNITKLNIPSKKKTAFYLDRDHGASVEYECFLEVGSAKPGSCRHLVLDNHTYLLEPDFSSGLMSYSRDDTDEVIHVIYEIEEEHDFKTDYILTDHSKHGEHVLRANKSENYTPHKTRRRKRAITNYKVEFLPVLDYPIYKFWYDRSNATTAASGDVDAIENIREFYAFVLNSIDLRYQSIVSTTIALQVVFAGIFIADTENNKVSATLRDQVDAKVTLTAFKQWLALHKSLPAYDHAMAFTGYDLVLNGSNSNAGIAWMNGACDHATHYANSISEDHFEASLAAFAAHELGHNLGSKHDGDSNACSADDRYLMSPIIRGLADERATNHFKFSTCSVAQIEQYIAKLDREKNNCLLNSTFDPSALDPYDGLEAGLLYSADVQCEANMGPGSYLCRRLYTDISEVCARMMCFRPRDRTCQTRIAWEGTVCGNLKLCRRGVCARDEKAPSVPDNCPQGDQPGIYFNNKTCKALIAAEPMYCYQAVVLSTCCESCRQYYIGIKGCEYGDHNTGCKLSSCPYYSAATIASGCCGTCAPPTTTTSSSTTSTSTSTTTSTITTPSSTSSPTTTTTKTTPTATTTSSMYPTSTATSTTTSTTTTPSTTTSPTTTTTKTTSIATTSSSMYPTSTATSTTTSTTTTPSKTTSPTTTTTKTTSIATTSSSMHSTSTATKTTTSATSSKSSTGSPATAAPSATKQTSTTSSTTSAETRTINTAASRFLLPLFMPFVCILMTFILF